MESSEGSDQVNCPVCGGIIDMDEMKCSMCGVDYPPKKKDKKKDKKDKGDQEKGQSEIVSTFEEKFEIRQDIARALFDAGYDSLKKLEGVPPKELAKVKGVGIKTANKILSTLEEKKPNSKKDNVNSGSEDLASWLSGESNDDALTSWLGEDSPGSAGKEEKSPSDKGVGRGEGEDSLKAWLSGEKDTLAEWLGESDGAGEEEPEPGEPKADVGAMGKVLEEREKAIMEREQALEEESNELEELKVELDTLKEKLRASVEGETEIDPVKLMEENAKITKELQHQKRLKQQMEDEIEKVKKGSVAVIKYMKAQAMKDKEQGSSALKKKLVEEIAMRKKIAIALTQKAEENKMLKEQLQGKIAELPEDQKELKEKEISLIEMEKELEAKEKELSTLEESLKNQEQLTKSSENLDVGLQERLAAELREKEQNWLEREEELKNTIRDLEEEVSNLRIEEKLRKESSQLKGQSEGEINEALENRAKELEAKEKSLLLREEEIRRLNDLVKEKDEELKRIKEPLKYKEEEINRREEDLMYREKKYQSEIQKLEQAKKEAGGSREAYELKQKLEDLNQKIKQKEDEVRRKEKYLSSKMEELRRREQGIIEEEIDAREEERHVEWQQEKVKTGTSRLDDLMLGGVPFGSNVMLYGDSFSGKEVMMNAFIAEGLKKGIPAIWVITNKMASDIREEMNFVVSGYEEYEKLGLVRYVDTYSRTIGDDTEEEHVIYLDDQTDHEGLLSSVNKIAEEFLEEHQYYRLGFRSISTLVSYLDPNIVFRFLTPFSGRRKKEKAVSFYSIEKGMHTDQEIQMIGSTMDGSIDFKVEQLNTMLAVKGVCDVQSRAYVRYEASKQGISIGSFSLDHIR